MWTSEATELLEPSHHDCPVEGTMSKAKTVVKNGVGFGSALAIAISWHSYQSILWAILHGFFGWFYVIYFAFTWGGGGGMGG